MEFLLLAIKLTPALIEAGENIAEFVNNAVTAVTKEGGPTVEDWNRLHDAEARLRAALDA